MIAGVAAGLADYFDLDVTLVRIVFILLFVFGFSGLLIYIVMWVAIPEKPWFQLPGQTVDYTAVQQPVHGNQQTFSPPYPLAKKSNSGRLIAGFILIATGTWFLLAELDVIPDWVSIFKLWPLVLIVLGLMILFSPRQKKFADNLERPVSAGTTDSIQSPGTDQADNQPLA